MRAKAAGADLVEFRVDDVFSGATGKAGEDEVRSIVSLVSRSVLPCIVTCRLASEAGTVGGYDGDEQARVSLFEHLGALRAPEHPPRYIDVELAAYTRSENVKQKVNLAVEHAGQGRDLSTGLILSTHDFDGRPADLTRRIAAMHAQAAASVHKVAYRARSVRDNLELLDLCADASEGGRPTIALGIGEFGLMSRVLAPKFGGFLTFASLDKASTTAPGQPTVDELLTLYRFREIGPRTRVYGVIGWPVEHSKSPLIHNAGFAEIGYDGVYLPIPVPPEYEHFKSTVLSLVDHPRLDFSGCSVTIPHKEHLVRLAREQGWEMDELSTICGAANTLVVRASERDGFTGTHVINTDGSAAVDALEAALAGLPEPVDLADARVDILGAGGVARAIAAELALRDAEVVLHNRTRARAEALARELTSSDLLGDRISVSADPLPRADESDAIVNCTPIGMSGTEAKVGGADAFFEPAAVVAAGPRVVMETVYTPRVTPLLAAAREAGIATVDGVEMFVAQAAAQFEAWTGKRPPRGEWERLVGAR